ncbi:MAG: hypothetical protein A2015_02250 [Spirochaetes bacterium GWF1_31_7]|nr:MAG: hypothetical protein A2Y30_06100 [Spirochaetes bacterium GWE1_32_154]OHD50737.1 MAG: hypothetical protein A2015_02250 [Spirochaetes bacterium GWF1_31_7]OHD81469.1 MAG: hypothetical protein A2355_11265 [Spirochaetes bacterium RIFOXYB1_FULL_32_8]HBD95074.1 hypothetical protein [Spirochaetia bacterium]HBI38040.1 hypothetical protein [Spirochaetia bacterium]
MINNFTAPDKVMDIIKIASSVDLTLNQKIQYVSTAYAGEAVYFPQRTVKAIRNAEILQDYYQHKMTAKQIAIKFYMSESTIFEILRKEKYKIEP